MFFPVYYLNLVFDPVAIAAKFADAGAVLTYAKVQNFRQRNPLVAPPLQELEEPISLCLPVFHLRSNCS